MIYFVSKSGFVKIGYSSNPYKRLKQLQTGSPERLELMFTIPGDRKLEKRLHKLLWRNREANEWFFLSPGLILYLKRLAEQGEFVQPNGIELMCFPSR